MTDLAEQPLIFLRLMGSEAVLHHSFPCVDAEYLVGKDRDCGTDLRRASEQVVEPPEEVERQAWVLEWFEV